MSRPRNVIQYSFEGGEADPQYERRADADLWLVTAKRMRNVRLVNGGGFARRPGTARIALLDGAARLKEFIGRDGDTRMLAFRDGGEADVFEANQTLEATMTGGAWNEADLATLQFADENDRIIVTHRSFWPQEILWDGSAFTVDDLEFADRQDNSLGQPYWRFQETRGTTMQPSGLSGAINLVTDADVFEAGHVGVRFRIADREVEITGVTDGQLAAATVIQALRPTVRLTVTSTGGFSVGDQCQSSVDDLNMEVSAIIDATHLEVLLLDSYVSPTTTSNKLMGPNAATDISGTGAAGTQAATVQWTEALISPVRGYPGGCLFHKGRLVLYDFPGAPELHAMSILRVPDDFDTGEATDDDAIIDGPGDATGRRVRWCVSSEQMLSLTEAGAYYVGEGPNTPVTPTTTEFLRIGPEPAGDCNPVMATEGCVFVESQGERMMLLAPSGQLRRVWGATEILAVASELLVEPTRLCLLDGGDWGPERYILAINGAGYICAVHYRRDSEITGAALWTMDGAGFVDVARFGKSCWTVIERDGAYILCAFDTDRLLDDSVIIANAADDTPEHEALADRTAALVWRVTAGGEDRRVDIGEFDADGDGALTDAPTDARTYEAGARFRVLVGLWPPIDPQVGPSTWQRIAAVAVDMLRAGMCYVDEKRLTPYRASDDLSQPPPLRTGWRKKRLLGRKRDYVMEITQVEAAPLEVRAITMEVR